MEYNPMSLCGRRILVTGASSGIGRACAFEAAKLGASVMLTGRRANELKATLDEMCKDDGQAHEVYPGDLTDSAFVKNLVETCGKIDGLVHAAGCCTACPVGFSADGEIAATFDLNYFSFLNLMRYYAKAKYRGSRMSVVAVSSVSAFADWAGVAVYSGSKGAVSASVRALAMELSGSGVRVNAVCPSNIRTPMYDSVAGAMNGPEGLKALMAKQPLGLGEPQQVASVVAFLLSDASSFVTGVNLPVDGGYLAQ